MEGLLSGETLVQSTERSSSHLNQCDGQDGHQEEEDDFTNLHDDDDNNDSNDNNDNDDNDDDDVDQAPCESFIVDSARLADACEGWRTHLLSAHIGFNSRAGEVQCDRNVTELTSRIQQLDGVRHSLSSKVEIVSFPIIVGFVQLPREPESPSCRMHPWSSSLS